MAAFVGLLADWVPKILEKLPSIVAGGTELYNKFRTFRSPSNEKKAVDEAMELIRQHQGDIDKLMEDRKQTMVMLQGLSIMMERLTQHYGSPGIHHLHSPHNQCCQRVAAPPCCHHDHGPRKVTECHQHSARARCAGHRHDSWGPPNLHHRGQRGPPHPGSRRKHPKGHSGCPCSFHPELPQCQESSDDEERGAASCEALSNWRVCAVCYDDYNTTSRRPTILMCGHTFCRQCLEYLAAGGPLRCPTCRAYEGRPTAVLPLNVVLMFALEEESPSRGSGAENTTSDAEKDNWNKTSTALQEDEELLMLRTLELLLTGSGAEDTNNDREEDDGQKASTFLQEEEESQTQTTLHLSAGCTERREEIFVRAVFEDIKRMRIVVERTSGDRWGMTITGGRGTTPYKDDDEGIFISRVTDGGPADQAGVKVGDKLLMVNGHDVVCDHDEVINIIKEAGSQLRLEVSREVTRVVPEKMTGSGAANTRNDSEEDDWEETFTFLEEDEELHTQAALHLPRMEILVERTNGHQWGMSIISGRRKTPYKGDDKGIFISNVTEGGPAFQAGVRVADKLLTVNGHDVVVCDKYEAASIIREAGTQLRLEVSREVTEVVPEKMTGSGAANTRNDSEENDCQKASTFLQEEEKSQIQTALHLSMRQSEAEGDKNNDGWKESYDLMLEEMMMMPLPTELSMRQSEAEGDRNNDGWKESYDLMLEEMMMVPLPTELSLESEVDRSAAVDSTNGPEASSTLQTVAEIRDSFTRIVVDEVLPKVQNIVLSAAEVTQHRGVLVRVKQEMVCASERLMSLLEQLNAIAFQDTDTKERQSRNALIKSIQFVMDVCDGIQEKATCLMSSRVYCGVALDTTHGPKAFSNLEAIQKIRDSFTRMAVDEVLPKVQSIVLFAAEATRHREALVRLRQEMGRASDSFMLLLDQLDAIAFQDTDTEGRQNRKALVKNIQFVMDVCDSIREKVKGLLL